MTCACHSASDLATRSLGEIAVALPGSTAVFRHYKLDFCCRGQTSLRQACADKGLNLAQLEQELAALSPQDNLAPTATGALIDWILERFHTVHRRELVELILLAEKVERVHADHPQRPEGLARLLSVVSADLDAHMEREELILFPLMRAGGHPMIGAPISVMRSEHIQHGETLETLAKLTGDFVPPQGACGSWQALYSGLRKLHNDLMEHIHLENNLLFPQFSGSELTQTCSA